MKGSPRIRRSLRDGAVPCKFPTSPQAKPEKKRRKTPCRRALEEIQNPNVSQPEEVLDSSANFSAWKTPCRRPLAEIQNPKKRKLSADVSQPEEALDSSANFSDDECPVPLPMEEDETLTSAGTTPRRGSEDKDPAPLLMEEPTEESPPVHMQREALENFIWNHLVLPGRQWGIHQDDEAILIIKANKDMTVTHGIKIIGGKAEAKINGKQIRNIDLTFTDGPSIEALISRID